MKRPDRVKIGFGYYNISYHESKIRDSEDTIGFTDNRTRSIEIRVDNVHPLELKNTLLHECLHAVTFELGLNRVNSRISNSDEYIVTSITNGLMTMMKENKELVEWLIADEHEEQLQEKNS